MSDSENDSRADIKSVMSSRRPSPDQRPIISLSEPKRVGPQLGAMITKISHKYRDLSIDTIDFIFNREFQYQLIPHKEGFESFRVN